jgi:hypothetical protein
MFRSDSLPMPTQEFADPAETDLLREILRATRKEHLELTVRIVRAPRTLDTVIVSGSGYAAGYRQGASWPDLFRSHLESGLFG